MSEEGIRDFYRGDTKKYKILVKNKSTGEPISVHNGVLTVTFKKKRTLPDVEASLQVIVHSIEPDPAIPTGEIRITLSSSDTEIPPGLYFYDFQFVSADNEVTTILSGSLTILQDTTLES